MKTSVSKELLDVESSRRRKKNPPNEVGDTEINGSKHIKR